MLEDIHAWEKRRLVDLAHYHNGYAFKPGDWSVDGTAIIRIEQVNNPNARRDHFQGVLPEVHAIDSGDLIFSWSATLKVAIWRHGKGFLNQHLFKVVPKSGFDKHFIFYVLDFHMDALAGGSHGSTMKHIKRGELHRYRVAVPPPACQRRIAEVLSTVDEAIEQTEALIAKTQQIKAGLMHDLFTRGVTADGKLRPTREEAPQLYKESSLGWIPKEWEVAELSRDLSIKHGFAFPGTGFHDDPPGPVLLTPGNFHRDGGLYFSSTNTKYFRGEVPPETVLQPGEMVTVMTDLSPQTLILGRFAFVESDFPVLHNQRIGLVKCRDSARWDVKYLCAALNSERIRRLIVLGATGTTVRHTSPGRLLQLLIARPSLEEQEGGVRALAAIAGKLASEALALEKMLRTKSGLLYDLLNGRVSVAGNAGSASAPLGIAGG